MSPITLLLIVLLIALIVVAAIYTFRNRNQDGTMAVPPLKSDKIIDSLGNETVPGLDNSHGVLNKDDEAK